ncbi:mediator of RNA polymerase II transcription subunit 15 isoform X2 [Nasonia vitripennis]|uniref:Chitin-binding type-2 domain-containing protein n=1 Tax=Nasonia vitripennis TaxID=7425 RepID=A0A7M7H8I7_NASVI|nr:mediator of RNA polymerase II transcription subunit 15 isoform X2 [Nasonia vitripennis]
MKIATTLFLFVVVGFSIGDELGFRDSLTNLEVSRRRSVQQNSRSGLPVVHPNVLSNREDARQVFQQQQQQSLQAQRNRVGVPPFKPLPPGASRPMAQQPERQRLVVQQNSTANAVANAPRPVYTAQQQDDILKQQQRAQLESKIMQQQKLQQEMLAMQMLKQQRQQQQEAMMKQQQQMVQYPQQALQQATQTRRVQQVSSPARLPNIVAAIPPAGSIVNADKLLNKPVMAIAAPNRGVPPFVGMPASMAQLTDRISNSPTILEDSVNEVSKDDSNQLPLPSEEQASSVNQMTLMSLQPITASENMQTQTQEKRQSMPNLPSLAPIQGMETSLKALAEASNITLEALEAAIHLRQQQLLQRQQGPTTTTSTTTMAPVKKQNSNPGVTKVMNAPREYYPVGYDKNFDDNFASRVDLPDTTFYCGDQKHFPGLYADEDLGCMVFHVCALTDDGLIMKSFLCPESTLFDQTILKCNWWFYVDCKSSKSLYDSNIPISKSYQLMKALAFFSAYKSHDNSTQHARSDDESS